MLFSLDLLDLLGDVYEQLVLLLNSFIHSFSKGTVLLILKLWFTESLPAQEYGLI